MIKYITIPGFESLSEQEVFNASLSFIRSTGKPGANSYGGCSYRKGCAASIFLTGEERMSLSNDASWKQLFDMGRVPETHRTLVSSIQKAHDDSVSKLYRTFVEFGSELYNQKFMELFEKDMRHIAYCYALIYKEVSK